MCGRFAEYESSDTGDGVCSMECKLEQLEKIKAQNRAVIPKVQIAKQNGAVPKLPPPLPRHRPKGPRRAEKIPYDYGMAAQLQHDGGLQTVTFVAGGRQRLVYSGGIGALKVWDVTVPQRDPQPIATVALHSNLSLRCCVVGLLLLMQGL